MKALLCSSFRYMGNFFVPALKIDSNKPLNVLFVAYALPDEAYMNQNKNKLKETLNIGKIIDLTPDYKFNDQIDIVFINGGLTDLLIESLYKHHQFEKLKNLIINSDCLYIGESAGSDFAGNFTHYNLCVGLPRNYSLIEKYGNDVFNGLRLTEQMIVTHASQWRVRQDEDGSYYRSPYAAEYDNYLKTIAKLDAEQIAYTTIGNNEALLIEKDGHCTKLTQDWSQWPIKELVITEHDKELKNRIMQKLNTAQHG